VAHVNAFQPLNLQRQDSGHLGLGEGAHVVDSELRVSSALRVDSVERGLTLSVRYLEDP
jgi:hypothetical protein